MKNEGILRPFEGKFRKGGGLSREQRRGWFLTIRGDRMAAL
jgi:hypothetical protein